MGSSGEEHHDGRYPLKNHNTFITVKRREVELMVMIVRLEWRVRIEEVDLMVSLLLMTSTMLMGLYWSLLMVIIEDQ